LVVGGAVHWLCLTDSAGYVLELRVRAAAPRLTMTKLPESFPYKSRWNIRHLMATMEAGGSPAVLVADGEKISAWTQSKHTARWNQQPQVVIEYEAISRFLGSVDEGRLPVAEPPLWRATAAAIPGGGRNPHPHPHTPGPQFLRLAAAMKTGGWKLEEEEDKTFRF
jgi:hypothetical protein